jgi:hypothetical protein
MNLHGGLRGARLGILVWDGADEVMRKEAGSSCRPIVLTLPDGDDLQRHQDWIKAETLAARIEPGEVLAITKA